MIVGGNKDKKNDGYNAQVTIFDEFPTVDCNDCSKYWDSSCDGADMLLKGSKMPCKAFSPTRSVNIPQELNALKKAFKRQTTAQVVFNFAVVGYMICQLLEKVFG